MRVLVVDDDCVDREHIKRAVMKTDSQCVFDEAETVDEALDCVRKKNFDVVLLDYKMPRRDGIELLIELRNEPKDQSMAIIMMSTTEDEKLSLECLSIGAQDFILKSDISAPRLRRAIMHARTRFELEQKLYKSYKEVKNLAEHDSLTGLANRYLFEETLKLAVTNNRRTGYKIALILFDLDNFKYVNDSHGHDVGDKLLKKVVRRINDSLRGNELFARLGGDEFAIVLTNLESIHNASNVAQRILQATQEPFLIDNVEVITSTSIGISVYPDSSHNPEDLFKFADIAMYRAKNSGRNQMCFFEERMQQDFLRRYQTEQQLRVAFEKNQLTINYQPLYWAHTSELAGFEALLRWTHNGEVKSPEEFIAVAEESLLIVKIGYWVIERAISQLANWTQQYEAEMSMSINLSVIQLADRHLPHFIKGCLSKYGVSPCRVEFELTETALLENTDQKICSVSAISEIGCQIALDDFGTGFSSISHLLQFPIKTVKIDKSLLLPGGSEKSLALVRGLSLMLHSLGLEIVAEGVETNDALNLCHELSIHRLQGFLLSKPLAIEDIEAQCFSRQSALQQTLPGL